MLSAELANVYFATSEGVYRAKFDAVSGRLDSIQIAANVGPVSFLAFNASGSVLYVATRDDEVPAVQAYKVGDDGVLEFLNEQPTGDGTATHLSVHPSGDFLMSAQYMGGSVCIYPLREDGSLDSKSSMIRHEGGAGHVEDRMEAPHPHWTGFSPDGRFAFVPDLGMNAVVVYSVVDGPSYIEEKAVVSSIYGGGPRHMRFSVDGKFVYLLNELTLSVTTFAYEPELGGLTQLTTTPALSEEVKRCETFNSGSEILVHPNGRFVYSGNRGHDSVTAFEVGQETGELHVVDVEPIRGSWPRHINLDPSGRWLLAAGARSNTVSVFSADPTTGHLQFPEWSVYSLPACICILFQN